MCSDVSSVSSAIVHSLPEIASPLETKTMAETKDAGTDLLQAAVGKRRRERLTRADSATLKQQKPLVAGELRMFKHLCEKSYIFILFIQVSKLRYR